MVKSRSSEPSGRMTPMWNSPPVCLVKAMKSPRGDQTGVEVLWRKPYMRSKGWTRILRPPADPPVAAPLVSGSWTHRVRWASELNVRATAPSGGKLGPVVATVKGGKV